MKFSLKIKNKRAKKIGNFFKKLPRFMGENAFLASLVFFSIAMILGLLVFYRYSILVERKEPKSSQALLNFDEKNLQAIIKAWQDRQTKFDAASSKQYVNPFELLP